MKKSLSTVVVIHYGSFTIGLLEDWQLGRPLTASDLRDFDDCKKRRGAAQST